MQRLWRDLDVQAPSLRPRWREYGIAVVSCCVACGAGVVTHAWPGNHLPFLFFACAVLLSAAIGGIGPGVAAIALTFTLTLLLLQPWLSAGDILLAAIFYLGFALAGERLHTLSHRLASETAKLSSREMLLKTIFDELPAAILTIDAGGLICSASAEAARLFGGSREQLCEMKAASIVSTYGRPERPARPRHSAPRDERVEGWRLDGSILELQVISNCFTTRVGDYTILYVRDLTEEMAQERRFSELQEELMHMGRVTSLGELSAAIAHELNQPLSAAVNFLGVASRLVTPEGVAGSHRVAFASAVAAASQQVMRAGSVLRKLRDFMARGSPERTQTDVDELIRESVLLARLAAREADAEVEVEVRRNVGEVLADRVQIQQVILNLVRNGIEAMEGAPERRVRIKAQAQGAREILVGISDTGPGVSPEIGERLFEPFITSKPEGMGVGLAICRTIIEAHGGRIWLNQTSSGAEFCFTLPRANTTERVHAG